ncbi:hypothetical protein BD413DRAFT_485507 [Trametes elegans]|nr:hypothetical protein BD413DRAFT_485507 [Trametes elegans]
MHFLTTILSTLALSATSLGGAAASVLPAKRQIVVPAHGTTVAPAEGSTILDGASFPFSYQNRNYCESGYSFISVYLSATPPAAADVTGGGELADGSFIYKFGDYLIPNFGLPAMSNPPPPPPTLLTPSLSVSDSSTLYLSVVETFRDCPVRAIVPQCRRIHADAMTPEQGGIQLEFGLETTSVVYTFT